MVRWLIFLLGMLSTRAGSPYHAEGNAWREPADPEEFGGHGPDGTWIMARDPLARERTAAESGRGRAEHARRPGRRRIPRWLKWGAILALAALIFRKVLAFAVLTTLSAALHLVGLNVHLPSIRLAWPWQSIAAGTTTDTDIGPWVLQKIEGITRPALGTENFNFVFTHKVSKSIGFWPCWYSSTFYAVGRAAATVDLNPGPGLSLIHISEPTRPY